MEPKAGFTVNQVLDFYRDKWIPEREKAFGGFNIHVGKGLRGDVENKIFLLFIFDSEGARNKYFKPEGGYHELNELGIKAWQQGQAVQDELERMATLETQWADWVLRN